VEALAVLEEALEDSTELVEHAGIFPGGVGQPGDGVSVDFFKRSVTLEEEVELLTDKLLLTVHDHSGHLEGEH